MNKKSRLIEGIKKARDQEILTQQEFRTLRGKILKGDYEGAKKGFKRIAAKKYVQDPTIMERVEGVKKDWQKRKIFN